MRYYTCVASRPSADRKAPIFLASKAKSSHILRPGKRIEMTTDAVLKDAPLGETPKQLDQHDNWHMVLRSPEFVTDSLNYEKDPSEQALSVEGSNYIQNSVKDSGYADELQISSTPENSALVDLSLLQHYHNLAVMNTNFEQADPNNHLRFALTGEHKSSENTRDVHEGQRPHDVLLCSHDESIPDSHDISALTLDTCNHSTKCKVTSPSLQSEKLSCCHRQLSQKTRINSWPLLNPQDTRANDTRTRIRLRIDSETDAAPSKKRSRKHSSSDTQSDLDDQRSTVVEATDSGEQKGSRLACQFYKKDPHKYHDCLKYELRRGKDVKQHIYRRHRKPDLYCPRCYNIFTVASFRDEHIRKTRCSIRVNPHFDGISEQQKTTLDGYVSRGKTLEEQWYHMWDTIFPDEPRPRSIYVGSYREEVMPLIRLFWDKKKQDILSSVLEESSSPKVEPGVIQKVMATVFDLFEAESAGSGSLSATPRVTQESAICTRTAAGDSNTVYTEEIFQQSGLNDPFLDQNGMEFDFSLLSNDNEVSWDWGTDFSPDFGSEFAWDPIHDALQP